MPRTPMRSIHKRLGVITGFLIILALLAINTAILTRQLAVQVGNQDWFSHSRRVVQELRTTESLVKEAETGQRGCLEPARKDSIRCSSLFRNLPRLSEVRMGLRAGRLNAA